MDFSRTLVDFSKFHCISVDFSRCQSDFSQWCPRTPTSKYTLELKQGFERSTSLFAFYKNDLKYSIGGDMKVSDLCVNILPYADDIRRSCQQLQRMINK